MGLLAQLFRHKNASLDGDASATNPDSADHAGAVRGIGVVAAAAGVRTAHGLPAEFTLPLGDILARLPQNCIWPGRHDPERTLRIPSMDIAPGLERGKPQISLARLITLAPEVFRWERSATEAPQVRLPIQKLLQQIRNDETAVSPVTEVARPTETAMEPLPISNHASPAPIAAAPASEIKLPPPAAPEAVPSVSVNATQRGEQMLELRPSKDVSISTTLRATVLGGISSGSSVIDPASAGNVLAPRVTPPTLTVEPQKVFSPSVVLSPIAPVPQPMPPKAPDFAGLQNLFMTDATLDLAGVAQLTASLPGVHACVISGTAGEAEAGDFARGVSVQEMREASENLPRLGSSLTDTVHRGDTDIAVFVHGEICIAALVKAGGFVPGVRERLIRIVALLAGNAASA